MCIRDRCCSCCSSKTSSPPSGSEGTARRPRVEGAWASRSSGPPRRHPRPSLSRPYPSRRFSHLCRVQPCPTLPPPASTFGWRPCRACRFRRRGARRHPSRSPSPSPRFRRRYRRSRPPPGSRPRSRRSCGIRPLLPLQWRPAKSGRKIRRGGEREGQGSRVWNRARSVESDIREGAGKDEMRGPLSLRSRQRTRRIEGP